MRCVTRKASPHAVETQARCLSRGQALVEMALVAGVLLLMLVFALEGGIALAMSHSFTEAAREGARHMTNAKTPESEKTTAFVENLVRESLAARFGSDSSIAQNCRVTVSSTNHADGRGTWVTVEVSYPLPGSWLINRSGSVRIAGRSVFAEQS